MRSFKGAIRFSLRTGTSETKARRGGEGGKKKGNFRNPAGALGPLRLYGGRAGAVSYTHLDVYKRQVHPLIKRRETVWLCTGINPEVCRWNGVYMESH